MNWQSVLWGMFLGGGEARLPESPGAEGRETATQESQPDMGIEERVLPPNLSFLFCV